MNSDDINDRIFNMMQKRNQQDIEFRAKNAKNCIDSPLSDPIAKSKAAWDLYILHNRGLAGLTKDQNLALQYLQYSAKLGNQDAKEELERLNTDNFTRMYDDYKDGYEQNFYKREVVSSTGLVFVRKKVLGDGDCGYTAFGITREDAYCKICVHLLEVKKLLIPAIEEVLIREDFINYIRENKLCSGLLSTFEEYQALSQAGKNVDDIIEKIKRFAIDLVIVQAYIKYDIKDKKCDNGWAHPCVLRALAKINGIKLFLYKFQANVAVPHEVYPEYIPEEVTENTQITYLLFINNNHFERLELRDKEMSEVLSDQADVSKKNTDMIFNLKYLAKNLIERASRLNKEMEQNQDDSRKAQELARDFSIAAIIYNKIINEICGEDNEFYYEKLNDLERSILSIGKGKDILKPKQENLHMFDKQTKKKYQEQLDKIRSYAYDKIEYLIKLWAGLCSLNIDEKVRAEKEFIKEVRYVYKHINGHHYDDSISLNRLIIEFIEDIKTQLGNSPVSKESFSIISLGSFARKEATPYSDFEFAVLLDDELEDSKVRQAKIYFVQLTSLLTLRVSSLGESEIPDSVYKNVFSEKLLSQNSGFQLDLGGKTPLGREDESYELIGKINEIVKYIKRIPGLTKKTEYHQSKWLPLELVNFSHLYGNEEITKKYKSNIVSLLSEEFWQKRYQEVLQHDYEKFDIFNNSLSYVDKGLPLNIKRDIYRFFDRIIESFSQHYKIDWQDDNIIDWQNPFVRLDKLHQCQFINDEAKHNLSFAVAIALHIRLVQKKYIRFFKNERLIYSKEVHEDFLIEKEKDSPIFKFYNIAFTLSHFVRDVLSNKIEKLHEKTFYNPTNLHNSLVCKRMGNHEMEAFFLLEELRDAKCSILGIYFPNTYREIADLYKECGDQEQANKYYEMALKSLEDKKDDFMSQGKIDLYYEFKGNIYLNKKEYKLAVDNYKNSTSKSVYFSLANAYWKLADENKNLFDKECCYEKALLAYNSIVLIGDPQESRIFINKSVVLSKLSHLRFCKGIKESFEFCYHAASRYKDSYAYIECARILLQSCYKKIFERFEGKYYKDTIGGCEDAAKLRPLKSEDIYTVSSLCYQYSRRLWFEKDFFESEKYIMKAIELDKNNEEYYRSLSEIFQERKNHKDAVIFFKSKISEGVSNNSINASLIRHYIAICNDLLSNRDINTTNSYIKEIKSLLSNLPPPPPNIIEQINYIEKEIEKLSLRESSQYSTGGIVTNIETVERHCPYVSGKLSPYKLNNF